MTCLACKCSPQRERLFMLQAYLRDFTPLDGAAEVIPVQALATAPYEASEAYPLDPNSPVAPTQFVTLACSRGLARHRLGLVQATPRVTKAIGQRNLAWADVVAKAAIDAVVHAELAQRVVSVGERRPEQLRASTRRCQPRGRTHLTSFPMASAEGDRRRLRAVRPWCRWRRLDW